MTEAEREHEWNRDRLLVEIAEAVERMLELTRHTHPSGSMLTLGATQQQDRLEAARERFVGSMEQQ